MSLGIPWRSRGWDATISLPRLQLQSLAGELRSCKLWSTVKTKQIPLVFELWAPPDNSEVHLKFLNLIATAKTSLTNKVTARGSRGRLWTCLWGHHSDHPRHLLRALSALPAPAPWTCVPDSHSCYPSSKLLGQGPSEQEGSGPKSSLTWLCKFGQVPSSRG